MQKYKICPSCHSKNEPTLLECLYCEADLTRAKITDEETEKMLEENAAAAPAPSDKAAMVRVCDCGEKNPANALLFSFKRLQNRFHFSCRSDKVNSHLPVLSHSIFSSTGRRIRANYQHI